MAARDVVYSARPLRTRSTLSSATSVLSSDLATFNWNPAAIERAWRGSSMTSTFFMLSQYSCAILGNRELLIHSQIADREPREIWPALACSGARSTNNTSIG